MLVIVLALVVGLQGCTVATGQSQDVALPRFTLWQLPSQTPSQMNSYVLRTQCGKVVVVDGGTKGEAAYLQGFLAALGNHVTAWFISHPHPDHIDALTSIIAHGDDLVIDAIYGSLPDVDWVAAHEEQYAGTLQAFNDSLVSSGQQLKELRLGEVITIDGIHRPPAEPVE